MNDVLVVQAIRGLFEFLPRSRVKPEHLEVRQECQLAAWMSFFGPASIQLGLSHNLGRRIGATYGVPHGITSCITLPHVMRAKAATEASRLAPMAQALGLVPNDASDLDAALAAADAVAGLVQELELPSRLRDVNVPTDAVQEIACATVGDSPQFTAVVEILQRAW